MREYTLTIQQVKIAKEWLPTMEDWASDGNEEAKSVSECAETIESLKGGYPFVGSSKLRDALIYVLELESEDRTDRAFVSALTPRLPDTQSPVDPEVLKLYNAIFYQKWINECVAKDCKEAVTMLKGE